MNATNSTNSPFFVKSAKNTYITLVDGTENFLTDATTYTYANATDDEPDAALFSKDDLIIKGNGTLSIDANYNVAIKCKDDLEIENGKFIITSVDDGIQGKDSLQISGGEFNINVTGDALKATENADIEKGYVLITGGKFDITAGSDGIQAETNVTITNGEFNFVTGGGNTHSLASDASAKAIKSVVNTKIDGGTFEIDSADDGVHSDGTIEINGGTFTIITGDDGIHAETSLTFNGGDINIVKSYEGIESAIITINNGTIHLTSSDDGVNVAGPNDSEGFGGGGSTQENGQFLYINGGYLFVSSNGDGLDANGAIVMTGGTVIVIGPAAGQGGNGVLDYDVYFKMNGGILIGVGTSDMAMAPSTSSTQKSVLVKFSSAQQSSSLIHVQKSTGEELFTFKSPKNYQSVVFSSPLLTNTAYDIYIGGSSTGAVTDGLYDGGTYSGGTNKKTFTPNNTVTNVTVQ